MERFRKMKYRLGLLIMECNVWSWQHLAIPEEIPQPDCTYGRQCVKEKSHFIVDTRPVIHVLIIQT